MLPEKIMVPNFKILLLMDQGFILPEILLLIYLDGMNFPIMCLMKMELMDLLFTKPIELSLKTIFFMLMDKFLKKHLLVDNHMPD